MYPASRGSIHITSPIDVYSPPDFDTGFISHPADLPAFVWAYKKSHEIVRRMPSFVAEIAGPQVTDTVPVGPGGEIRNREYSKEDDILVENLVRQRISTCFHPLFGPPGLP